MNRLFQAAAVLTIVFTFATGFDIPHRNIELFSHFRLQYFVVSVLLLIGFSVMRRYAWAGTLAVTVIFNASFVLPWYVGNVPVASGTPIKLLLTNVRSKNNQYNRVIDLVEAEEPDLVFLQEVTDAWVTGMAPLLEKYPYAYAEPRAGSFGLAVFSKIPFESVQHVDSPPLAHPTIVATIMVNDAPLSIVSTHPMVPIGRRNYEVRNAQLQSIAELVNETSGKLVLLGDLNASIWDPRFRQLEVTTGLSNARRGFGVLPTWPTFFPIAMIPIDHALVTDDISVTDIRTAKRIGSDHLPLIVTLTL